MLFRSFMRCGVIGAPGWELLMANTSAEAAGVSFGSPEFTESIFVLCLFGMTFASAPYFLNTMITLKPMDLAVKKAASNESKGKPSFLPVLGNAAMMGIMGYSLYDYLIDPNKLTGLLVSGVVSFILMKVAAKTGKRWLGDFNMAFAMVFGLAAAQIMSTIL